MEQKEARLAGGTRQSPAMVKALLASCGGPMKRVKLQATTIYIPVEDPDGEIEIDDGLLEMTLLAAQCMAKVSDECAVVHEANHQAEQQYEHMTLDEFRATPVRTRPRGYRQ